MLKDANERRYYNDLIKTILAKGGTYNDTMTSSEINNEFWRLSKDDIMDGLRAARGNLFCNAYKSIRNCLRHFKFEFLFKLERAVFKSSKTLHSKMYLTEDQRENLRRFREQLDASHSGKTVGDGKR